MFHPLDKSHIKEIVQIQIRDLSRRLEVQGLTLELTAEASEFLAEKGYDPSYGARPLRRAIQKYLEDPIAEELLKGIFVEGSAVRVKVHSETGELWFTSAADDKGPGGIPAENPAGAGGTPTTPPGQPEPGKKE